MTEPDPGERPQTTVRAYTDTAGKIARLAKYKKRSIHDLIDDLFLPTINEMLLAEIAKEQASIERESRG